MNTKGLHRLEQALLEAGRRHPPSGAVPYAFEQRVMARIRASASSCPEAVVHWIRGLWRSAMAAMAAAALLVGVDWVTPGPASLAATDQLSGPALEETLLASAVPEDGLW
ncbi:MAG: hypothetical protein KIT22_13445 [Verrucomicrobiae bacterium]|nr:hypothetical protein [Verrucomicrobiae bacterium]